MNKVSIIALFLALMASITMAQSDSPEIKSAAEGTMAESNSPEIISVTEGRGSLVFYFPGDDDTWDKGIGIEAQLVFWRSSDTAIALSVGVTEWDLEDFATGFFDPVLGVSVGVAAEGDAQLIPLGVSVLYKPELTGGMTLTLEGGLRYVIVESSVDAAVAATGRGGTFVVADEIDIDNGIVGLIAADVAIQSNGSMSFFGGIGYQFDISKGETTFVGEDIGDNELKAFLIRVGITSAL